MRPQTRIPRGVDEYIAGYPLQVQVILRKMRKLIRELAPEAQERISYQIPSFRLNGRNLIHFAAFKNHIGLYPVPREHPKFAKQLAAYEGGKGTLRLPLDREIPYGLITKIVKFRIKENAAETAARRRT